MTNVIPFRQPIPPAKPYLLLTILIDPNAALEEGDRVLLDRARDGSLSDVLFHRWWGPTEHGDRGQFVTRKPRRIL
jgi:hypothetical protein